MIWTAQSVRRLMCSMIHAASIKPCKSRGSLISTHSEIVGINVRVSVLEG